MSERNNARGGDDTEALLARLRATWLDSDVQRFGPPAKPDCWALEDPEACCSGLAHSGQRPDGRWESWACPARRSREWRQQLLPTLVDLRCGLEDSLCDDGPMATRLLAALREDVQVTVAFGGGEPEPVGAMIGALTKLVLGRWQPRRSLGLYGKTGTGKTHMQLCLFFTAVEAGLNVAWLDEPLLREVVTQQRSGDVGQSRKGADQIIAWRKTAALFINDLGFDDHPPPRDLPGRPLLASTYWQLLEGTTMPVVWSSNQVPASKEKNQLDLCRHPDVGERVVSRLLGRLTGGLPMLLCKFEGEDQRIARLLAAGGRRL